MSKTKLLVKLATEETLPVRSRFEDNPPTIVIEFPTGRVAGSIPERSVIQRGVIQEIQASYASATRPGETRWIKALNIQLRDRYGYAVRSEPGQIVVEIEHPKAFANEAVEVGLAGGVIVPGTLPPAAFSERFRAMQEAMMRASPKPWVWRASSGQQTPGDSLEPTPLAVPAISPDPPGVLAASPVRSATAGQFSGARHFALGWVWTLLGIGVMGGLGWWRWARQRIRPSLLRRTPLAESGPQSSSAIRIVDELVWRAFERQGYQLLHTVEVPQSLGPLRIIMKEGSKAALLCVGNGVFFEKNTVEQFVDSMKKAQATQGYLVAPGSFTVPAQRCAKEHGVILLGRDQLTELLSAGAMSEYYNKQLQQLHGQLEEARETLSQYARQLDLIRRQRNEASWFLGEERTKTAKLEAQLSELSQQTSFWQAQAEQWQQTADITRKQWEESQWYLGEAKASAKHLEERMRTLHEAFGQLEERHRELTEKLQETDRQRAEANWYLGESQAIHETLRQQVQQLERHLKEAQDNLDAAQVRHQALEAELDVLRTHGERRKALRMRCSDVMVELQNPDGMTLFQGIPRDMSHTGFGFDSERPIDLPAPSEARQAGLLESLRVRLFLPGWDRPLESTGRLVWQRQDPATHHHLGGCQLFDVPTDTRKAFEQALTNP